MTVSRTPTLAEVLNALKLACARGFRVSLPGQVQKYDPSTQLADVQPLIADTVEDPDGNLSNVNLPIVTNCPVAWPAGGGMFLSMPLAVGDTGTLIVADRTIDGWLSQGGLQAPADQRRHHLSDSTFFPGAHDNKHALQGVDPSVITLGSSGGSADFVALAAKVLTQLQNIVNAFNSHTHPVPGVTVGSGATTSSTPTAGMGAPSSVASGTVKVNG